MDLKGRNFGKDGVAIPPVLLSMFPVLSSGLLGARSPEVNVPLSRMKAFTPMKPKDAVAYGIIVILVSLPTAFVVGVLYLFLR